MAKKKTQKKTSSSSVPAHLAARVKKLRQRMGELDLDAYLINYHTDQRYLTDAELEDSWVLVTSRAVWALSDFRFDEHLDQAAPHVKKVIRSQADTAGSLGMLAGDLKLKAIGYQAEHTTMQQYKAITKHIAASKLKATQGVLNELRAIKDDVEIRQIKRAISVMEQAFVQTVSQIRPQMSEREIAALLEYNMRWIGADGPGFPSIIAVGPNSSICHHTPGRTRANAGKVLLIDFGAETGGYRGDITRTLCMGELPKRIAEIYDIVLEAHDAAIDAIRPGRPLKAIDAIARGIITDAGFGDRFGHGLGHGIGLDIHEAPRLAGYATGELQAGHVVTVEPGIYLPGLGGVRIEDDVLVTEKGGKVLTALPTDRESAII